MADNIRFVNAVHFGPDGRPRLQRVPIQTFAIGRGLEVPHLTSVFHTPAPTNYLVVRLRRSGATLIAHFPIQPRAARRPPVCANVLVCRADEAFQGYVDCDAGDFVRARIAAGFALATCRNEDPRTRASDEVPIRESREAYRRQ